MSHPRMRPDAGIAIAAILFVIGLLAILAAAIAAGTGDFGTAGIADRITADVASQANLIRSKINECNLIYGTNSNYDGYPTSGGAPVLVSSLGCTGDPSGMQSLWSGERPALLPPPTNGFGPWYYINTNSSGLGGTAAGGRCIYTSPILSNPSSNTAVIEGLSRAANKFTNGTSYSSSSEVIYDPASASQKFVVWITVPPGAGSPDSNCLP